jgi:hypothetical protein
MQVNFEKAVKTLIEKWNGMTDGRKPIFVRIIAYWPKDYDVMYIACISCNKLDIHDEKEFPSFNEAAKWLASKITAMIGDEFYGVQKDKENA